MKFRRSAPVVLITSALMVIATISLVSNLLSHRMAAAFAHNNRDGLLAAIQDAYQVLRENYGLSQAQFHLAVATDFSAWAKGTETTPLPDLTNWCDAMRDLVPSCGLLATRTTDQERDAG